MEQNDYRVDEPKPLNTRIILGAAIGLTILVVVAGFLAAIRPWNTASISPEEAALSESVNLFSQGRFEDATQKVLQVTGQLPEGSGSRALATSLIQVGKFHSGNSDERVDAIRIAKESYLANAGKPFDQVLEINKVLGYILSANEDYIFDAVFTGEPFARYMVENDRSASIKNLSEHSLELFPTVEAHFKTAIWYSDRIRNTSGDWKATDAQKKQYAQEILRIIDAAPAIFEAEKAAVSQRAFDYMLEPRYHFWRVFLYGVVARVEPEYIDDARRALDDLIASYENSRGPDGERIELISTRLPYGYYNYAAALQSVKGSSAREEIVQNLDAMIALVDRNPELHAGSYLASVREGAQKTAAEQKREYPMWIRFAGFHPPYKAWLEKYGWTFAQ